jgi:putative ABC transport system ATP-binding protein
MNVGTPSAGSPRTGPPAAGGEVVRSGAVVARLDQVQRIYGEGESEVRALDGFSFEFLQGEYWAVMGSSGSGKSTLLNILGCLDRPTSGDYFVRGTRTADLDDNALSELRSRELGFVFQSYNLIAQLDVLENITVPLLYQDDPPKDGLERGRYLAERVGLGNRIRHRPKELSGGQQQRVAIARALINDPALILADEATGNLDSQTAQEILALFDELHAEGKTIVLVTHEPTVGARAQHLLRMKDGRMETVRLGAPRAAAAGAH